MVFETSPPIIDCFAPTLGHTSLRCVELDRSQARLLMLPATIYFVASLVTGLNWMRLVLARRDIQSSHFGHLMLHGQLVFTLATADYTHKADQVPYASSRWIGGLSVLTSITLICSIASFLPPRQALRPSLDRALTATGFAAALQILLSSISRYTPDGLNRETTNNVYAAGACMLVFYLSCLVASQQSRFFALPAANSGDYHAFESLGWKANVTFIVALFVLLAQTPFAFDKTPSFGHLITASMLGSIGYLLLVATSIVAHYNTTMMNVMQSLPVGREKEMQKRQEESFHIEGDLGNLRVKPGGREAVTHLDIERTADQRASHDQIDASEVPVLQTHKHEGSRGSVIWKGDGAIASRLQVQSGVSAASWDRLENLMQARRRAQSNLTYYGSEQSYAHQEGSQTRPTSIMTSAGLANFFGVGSKGRHTDDIPPVPAIDPRHLQSPEESDEIIVAKPLTEGDAPIVLSPAPSSGNERSKSPIQQGLTSLPGLIWNEAIGKREGKGNRSTIRAPSALVSAHRDSKRQGQSEDTTMKSSVHTVTATDPRTSEADSIRGLALRYSSSKLFPSPMTALNATAKTGMANTIDEDAIVSDGDEEHVEFTAQYAARHADDSMGNAQEATDEKARKRNTSDSADEGKKISESSVPQTPSSPTAASPSRKVNRGKVIRKIDMAEDQGPRLTTAILFPGAR